MAKYVCDFERVRSAADKLISSATELESNSNNHFNNMSNCLNGWNGEAKSNFMGQCNVKADEAILKAQEVIEIGNHIKTSVNKIEEVEQELGNLSI